MNVLIIKWNDGMNQFNLNNSSKNDKFRSETFTTNVLSQPLLIWPLEGVFTKQLFFGSSVKNAVAISSKTLFDDPSGDLIDRSSFGQFSWVDIRVAWQRQRMFLRSYRKGNSGHSWISGRKTSMYSLNCLL